MPKCDGTIEVDSNNNPLVGFLGADGLVRSVTTQTPLPVTDSGSGESACDIQAIRGQTDLLKFDESGNLKVTYEELSSNIIIARGANAAIAPNSAATLVTYTNNTGSDVWIDTLIMTGEEAAEYTFFLNTSEIIALRCLVGDSKVLPFYPALRIVNGNIVDLKIIHYGSTAVGFKGTIMAHK